MKIKGQSAAAVVALVPVSKPREAMVAHATPELHVEPKRDDQKLQSERAADWEGLVAVSDGSLFGQPTPVEALVARYGLERPSRPLEKFLDGLAFIQAHDFGSPAHDRKHVAKRIAKGIDMVKDTAKHLRMNDLDGGVHKLRRLLRWIAIDMQSAGGLVQVKGAHLPPLKKSDEPIHVPKALYKQLQDAIEVLGDIKDDCERYQLLTSAYEEVGMRPENLGSKGTPKDMEARATVVYEALKKSKLLKKLQKVFEDA